MSKKALCIMCQGRIEFNGKYWVHVDSHPRHIGKPLKSSITYTDKDTIRLWKPISEKPEFKRQIITTDGDGIAQGTYSKRKKLDGWCEFIAPGCYEEEGEKPTHWMYLDDLLKEFKR